MSKFINLTKEEVKSIEAKSPSEFVVKLWDKILSREGRSFFEVDKLDVKDYKLSKDAIIAAYDKLIEFGPDAGFWGLNYFPDISTGDSYDESTN